MARSWPQGARTVRWAPNKHACTFFLRRIHEYLIFIFYCSGSRDLSVGSSDRLTDREDFDRTHQVDHLALLGTAPSVSTRFIIFSYLLTAAYFTPELNFTEKWNILSLIWEIFFNLPVLNLLFHWFASFSLSPGQKPRVSLLSQQLKGRLSTCLGHCVGTLWEDPDGSHSICHLCQVGRRRTSLHILPGQNG